MYRKKKGHALYYKDDEIVGQLSRLKFYLVALGKLIHENEALKIFNLQKFINKNIYREL